MNKVKRLSNDIKLFQAVKAGLAGIEELGGNWENLKSGMRFYIHCFVFVPGFGLYLTYDRY